MFFYSPNVAPQPSSTSHRRPTLTHQHHLHVGHLDTRLSVQIPEILSRSLVHDPERTRLVPEQLRFIIDENQELWTGSQPPTGFLELCASPVSSVFSNADARRMSQRKLVLRRPTISIQEDGKIIIGAFKIILYKSIINYNIFSFNCSFMCNI